MILQLIPDFIISSAPVCPIEKGFLMEGDKCLCPADRGFYVDENGNCVRCLVELGYILTEDGRCICDPSKGYVVSRDGSCDCPLPAEKDDNGNCVGEYFPIPHVKGQGIPLA